MQAMQTETGMPAIAAIKGLDVEAGLRHVAGNRKLYNKLLGSFAVRHADVVREMRGALNEQDFELAERLAHTLKGVAGTLGAGLLHEAAKSAEAAIKGKDRKAAESELESLGALLDPFIEGIRHALPEEGDAPPPWNPEPLDAERVAPVLRELKGQAMNKPPPVILAVDDTPENIDVLVGLLGDKYRLKVASDGQRAMHLATTGAPPDLILLDIMMPGMDGFEVCRRIKAQESLRDIPVIFISALENVDEKIRAFTAGGVDYVTKPFQPEELKARVATHLALRRLQAELEERNSHLDGLVREKSRELAAAHDRLSIADQAKGEFLQLISHELRTPTNGVLGIADLAFDCFPENEEVEELRPLFNQSRDRMLAALDDALLLARIHVSRDGFHATPVPLGRLLVKAAHAASGFALDSGAGVDPLPACEAIVAGDEELFTTALTSLLQTAIAFTACDQTVAVSYDGDADKATVTMEGRGRGLSSEAAAGFFDVFGTVRNSTSAEVLGLKPAVAERIISLYGGNVQIRSLACQGVELKIVLQKHSSGCGNHLP
ncbi:MAG: response regulator [Verrucomicrobiota bacterium]